jgi:hypothetical protein
MPTCPPTADKSYSEEYMDLGGHAGSSRALV